ncbi:MAG TPA: bifunctional DNA-binding transcriptional regulator/O6-methylguanine-DNA methyltransferase Ada [Caulobacteraceae bacterium]|nr:bifunctional DNA-binding transcriptional regulator/O6-methylguanine-DNA methyltransferase Ada [Caulobacteraceae bacterium]
MLPKTPLDEARWKAVSRRDPGADGDFVFCVKTTGVYCRPSCTSRPARRENVVFHVGAAEAEAVGFRACKRCRPNEEAPALRRATVIAAACRTIEAAETPPSLAELARGAELSPHHFHRLFKAVTGVTPKGYADAHRARRVREGLAAGASVTEAIYEAGFNSGGRFYARSGEVLGMTPTRYRRGGERALIRFAVGQCALGAILVAATDAGVCAILLGDDPDALTRDLQDRFPRAELIGADAAFEDTVAKVVGLVDEPRRGLDLPLDIRGAAFQQRVWAALRQIRPGETASYGEIARRIGAPRAARAVAQACAANPLAIAIPCHRVVRQDGSSGGYAWGVERKQALLTAEGAP